MASRDLHSHLHLAVALNIAAIAANTTTQGVIINTDGYEGVEFSLQAGGITDGSFLPQIIEGNAADLSDGVVATNLIGTPAAMVAADANTVQKLGYFGSKQYVRLELVSTGVTTGGTFGAVAALGYARNQPVT